MHPEDSTRLPAPFGSYELTELIGEGDIGRVYAARSLRSHGFDKRLVIKKIRRELCEDPRYVEDFVAEAGLACSLSHTNIVQVVELGELDGLPFIVMEHVCGMNLAQCNDAMGALGRRWDPMLAAFVTAEVAMGLDHAHRRRDLEGRPLGIVHQDVSPSNVLLSYEGAVKLTDFGMAGVVGAERLARAAHPRYLAPEQVRGEPVDPRTDVYGCGLLLYEMLAGRPPLEGLSREEAIDRLGLGTVPVLGDDTRGSISPALVEVLAKAIAPWPDERFEDAAALYEALMSTVFSSGRHVGRRELVALLETLREAETPTTVTPSEEVAKALGSWYAQSGLDRTSQHDLSYENVALGLGAPSARADDPEPSEPRREPTASTPMRGRVAERERLAELVAAAASGQASLVEVLGDEGVGKTRLVHEVVGKLQSRSAPMSYCEVSCRDLPRGGRFAAARAMIRAVLGLRAPTDGADLERATKRLRELGLSQYELEAIQDVIGVGPGKAPPGPGRARAAGRGLGQLLRTIAAEKLTILFWDDCDLMDPDSARLVARARKHSSPSHLLVVVARTDGPTPWPSAITGDTIRLAGLGDEPLRRVIEDVLEADHVADSLAGLVLEKANGNPRFVMELARFAVETGKIQVDDGVARLKDDAGLGDLTLDSIIDARLDCLTDLERAVLEVAACVGIHFERWLIAGTTGLPVEDLSPTFEALSRAKLLTHLSGEDYAFSHQRLRKRVLASLGAEDLVEIQARIAETIASSEVAGDATWRLRCATHLRDSGQRARARDLLATSAAQLELSGATDAAIDHFSAALEMTHGADEAPVALALGLRTASLALKCGRTREGLRAANLTIDIARKTRNGADEIKALILAGKLVGAGGHIEDASNRFRKASEVARGRRDENAQRMARAAIGELLVQTGDYRRAVTHLESALEGAEPAERLRLEVLVALCRGRAGDEPSARQILADVRSRLDDQDVTPAMMSSFLFATALVDATAGRHDAAVEALQRVRELARAHGFHHDNALAAHHMGCFLLALGHPKRAFAALSYSYELSREYGFERLIRVNVVSLATLDVLHHRRPEPLERIQAALEEAREAGFLSDILQIRFYLGQALLALGQFGAASRQLEQARRAGRATGNLLFDADIQLLLDTIP